MRQPIAFVSAEWNPAGHDGLRKLGYDVRAGGWGRTGRALERDELVAEAAGAAVLIVEVERVESEPVEAPPTPAAR